MLRLDFLWGWMRAADFEFVWGWYNTDSCGLAGVWVGLCVLVLGLLLLCLGLMWGLLDCLRSDSLVAYDAGLSFIVGWALILLFCWVPGFVLVLFRGFGVWCPLCTPRFCWVLLVRVRVFLGIEVAGCYYYDLVLPVLVVILRFGWVGWVVAVRCVCCLCRLVWVFVCVDMFDVALRVVEFDLAVLLLRIVGGWSAW